MVRGALIRIGQDFDTRRLCRPDNMQRAMLMLVESLDDLIRDVNKLHGSGAAPSFSPPHPPSRVPCSLPLAGSPSAPQTPAPFRGLRYDSLSVVAERDYRLWCREHDYARVRPHLRDEWPTARKSRHH